MSGATPGPYIVNPFNAQIDSLQEDENGDLIPVCQMLWPTDLRSEAETLATAHVLAAAPDLLAALELAVEKYGKPGGPWNVPSDPGGWLDRARAAILKAKGDV